MKLVNHFSIRFSVMLVAIFSIWAVLFYLTVMIEVNDEIDDSLEDFAENIISQTLAGVPQPTQGSASNNQHFIQPVSQQYALSHQVITYSDSTILIPEKNESEPARVYTCLFQDKNGQNYLLTVFTPTIEKYDIKEAITVWLVGLYVVMMLVLIGSAIWSHKRNLRPLYKLLNWLDTYQPGGNNPPLDNDTSIDELDIINQAINRSVARGEQMLNQQKQFISNASHEMQTPIAICQNRLEMLLESANLTDEQLGELTKVMGTLGYMTKLNKSLLMLARIDNGQFSEQSILDVNALTQRLVADFNEAYAHLRLNVSVNELDRWLLPINDTLGKMLIVNVIKNAYIHNVAGGEIAIEIGHHYFWVKNTAKNGSLNTERLFERFNHGEKHEGSTGLGLSICDSICRSQGLTIQYTYNQMHCFTVRPHRKQ